MRSLFSVFLLFSSYSRYHLYNLLFILLSLFLLFILLFFPSCTYFLSNFVVTNIARISHTSPFLLFLSFSLVRGRHSVAFCLYLSATGRLFVAQSLYIKRQGVCYFPPPFREARWLRIVGQTAGISIIWICYRIDIISSRRLLSSCLYISLRSLSVFSPSSYLSFHRFSPFSFFLFYLLINICIS